METETTSAETVQETAASDKTIAIIAYLTLIGLIIAFVMNKDKKEAFGAYHIRQCLGLCVCGVGLFIIGMVPILGWILSMLGSLFMIYLWIMGLMNALNGNMKPIPFVGKKFEEWFANV